MRCLKLVEKKALYISSILFGCIVVCLIVLLRTQTMAVVNWVSGIDLTPDNVVFGLIFILIVWISLSRIHHLLSPEPLNCSHPMKICFLGLFGGALAALIIAPLGLLGLGLMASSLLGFVWAMVVFVVIRELFYIVKE